MRELLHSTWYAFFAHYRSLREIQEKAIGPILEGRSVLLASATASGKTEAYMAPLCERWIGDMRQGILRVAVVCPTKALTNDLLRRLQNPCQRCGIKICLRTGDHPRSLEGSASGVLLTTLESFDSLISRHPRELLSLRAVVADELHVLEGSARGDQLAVLLSRLQKMVTSISDGSLQRIAATATIDYHDHIARKYLGEDALVVQVPQGRPIRLWTLDMPELNVHALIRYMLRFCRQYELRKFLFFVPSRALAEELGAALRGKPPFINAVFVHHGSLSTEERERVEHAFLNSNLALCLATNTLEVGIDIGDVDMVVIWGPPTEVSGFLQRLGRGNRRSEFCRVLAVVSCEAERLRFRHLLECAENQRLLSYVPPFRASVLVQQAFSMTLQNPKGFITAKAMWERLPGYLCTRYNQEALGELLANLAAEEYYLHGAKRGQYLPTDKLLRLFERGLMHGNISDGNQAQGVRIFDETTGRLLGIAERTREGELPKELRMAGRGLVTVTDEGDSLVMRSGHQARAYFNSKGSAPISYELAWDFARYLKLDDDVLPVYVGKNYYYVGHFLGSQLGKVLAVCLQEQVGRVKAGSFILRFSNKFSWKDLRISEDTLKRAIFRHERTCESILGVGPWAGCLPQKLARRELQEHARLDLVVDNLAKRRPVEVSDGMGELFHQLLDM